MDASITFQQLLEARATAHPPLIVDVRRGPAFLSSPAMIAGALRRAPEEVDALAAGLPPGTRVVACCVHGHEVSQNAARALRAHGHDAHFLEGGFEHWRACGGPLLPKPAGAASRWVTRERPKVDRIACPWLIARFIDRGAEFLYVPPQDVPRVAEQRQAVPYDVPGATFSHRGEACSFDAFLDTYALGDPALRRLAVIVRGADTARPDLAPQAAGLLSLSVGLSRRFADDHEMLRHGMLMYDALYFSCLEDADAKHARNAAIWQAPPG